MQESARLELDYIGAFKNGLKPNLPFLTELICGNAELK
jgi:hypothetical protein